ncbi:class I SAM-dependent methyltransferase [Hymenobacter sp. H14-R3]|uniref:class I SAM-dependent methyltransferase n=1 Tax=Hymenobacter sp. H14-R3 TaxID=3046308 RepID=UPI0024B9CF2E|nr:class I SAM-dependent methyltransferase [Hymenobacter sp. H14-R3]MDJ0365990.1 class I SAM-dependent methyltransferase [Hymenobacter sp. H14-R3]
MRNRISQMLDSAAVFRFHRQRIREYGAGSPGALGWNPVGQQIRFKTLAQIGDLSHCSVLDVGCGYADLYPFLKQRFTEVQYQGIEHMPELLEVAKARYADAAGITLQLGDFLKVPLPLSDYVLASGALSYRNRDPHFVPQAIERLYGSCRRALGFNLLDWAPAGGGPLAAFDPAEIVAFCETLSPNVVLLNDYWKGDFTVLMYR